jgi:hypothetical protein
MAEIMRGMLADELHVKACVQQQFAQQSAQGCSAFGVSEVKRVTSDTWTDMFPLPLPWTLPKLLGREDAQAETVREDTIVHRIIGMRKRKDSFDLEDVRPSSELSAGFACTPRLKQLRNSSFEDSLCGTPVKIPRADSIPEVCAPSTPTSDIGLVPLPSTPLAAKTSTSPDRLFKSPPAAPNYRALRHETIDDINIALSMESLPLLSAALGRAHACKGKCCGKGDHSLHEAIAIGHYDAVSFLLKRLPLHYLHEACTGVLPLTRAISIGIKRGDHDYALALLLLQHGANPNLACGPHADTALHLAAASGAINAVKLLLENGADHDARNAELLTPLHAACQMTLIPPRMTQERVVVCLLKHGADPTLLDKWGQQAADYIGKIVDCKINVMMLMNRDAWYSGKLMTHVLRAKYLNNRTRLRLARGQGSDDNILQKLPLHLLDSVVHYI